jgi:hypothetical protein
VFVLCSRDCLICLCGFKGAILGVTRSYFGNIVEYVVWTLILKVFWMIFMKGFLVLIWAVLLRRTLFPLKPNIFWCDLFGSIIQDTWKVSLIWPQDRKWYLGVCKHHLLKIFFFLFLLMDYTNICHQLNNVLSLNITSWFYYFPLMGFVMFAVRRAWITLGSTQYNVESF